MNVWIRAPGIFYVTILGYAGSHYQYRFNRLNYSDFQFWCSIIALLTNYWNAFYFLERVVGSYHKKLLKIELARKKVEQEAELVGRLDDARAMSVIEEKGEIEEKDSGEAMRQEQMARLRHTKSRG